MKKNKTMRMLWVLFVLMLGYGCTTSEDLTSNTDFNHGLRYGDRFRLRNNAFYCTFPDHTSIVPECSLYFPFSVAEFETDRTAIKIKYDKYDTHKHIKGIVPKGTIIQFERITGYHIWPDSFRVCYYGSVLSGPYTDNRKVSMEDLFFEHPLDRGISGRYVEKVTE